MDETGVMDRLGLMAKDLLPRVYCYQFDHNTHVRKQMRMVFALLVEQDHAARRKSEVEEADRSSKGNGQPNKQGQKENEEQQQSEAAATSGFGFGFAHQFAPSARAVVTRHFQPLIAHAMDLGGSRFGIARGSWLLVGWTLEPMLHVSLRSLSLCCVDAMCLLVCNIAIH